MQCFAIVTRSAASLGEGKEERVPARERDPSKTDHMELTDDAAAAEREREQPGSPSVSDAHASHRHYDYKFHQNQERKEEKGAST